MARATGIPVDPFQGFKFRVRIQGFDSAGFRSVSGLREETEIAEYREGNNPRTMIKVPGLTSFDNVVLEKGMSPNDDFVKWRQDIITIQTSGFTTSDGIQNFRRNVTIELFDKVGKAVKSWNLFDAWPTILEVETLDATSSDILIERLELAHEGLVQKTPSVASIVTAATQGEIQINT